MLWRGLLRQAYKISVVMARPASADNGHWAKVPENHANIALSGQNDLLINGSASFLWQEEGQHEVHSRK
jgi:hypothetical protein